MDIDVKKKIIIFGAGTYGVRFYLYLYFCGLADNVKCFMKTDSSSDDSICGKPVIGLKEYINKRNGSDIYIAVSAKYINDIKKELNKNRIGNIHTIPVDFLESIPDLIFDKCCEYPIKNNIFFDSFNGLGYSDNCKYILEKITKTSERECFIWHFDQSNTQNFPHSITAVKRETPEYYLAIYTSRVIVSNTVIPNSIMKRKGQYYIYTWHGIGPSKKVGKDFERYKNTKLEEETDRQFAKVDLMIAASDHCEYVYRHSFGYKGEIQKWGYPRNDIFFYNDNVGTRVRDKYELNDNCKIVLYAPTFRRELSADELINRYIFEAAKVIISLSKRFKGDFVWMYRLHPEVRSIINSPIYEEGIDASDYPDMQELLVAADILITDYSSSMWDFSLSRKPVFLYFNDKDECEERTGFYRDPDTYPYPKGHTTEELCRTIETFDNEKYQRDLDEWFAEYGTYDDGHASERVVDRIIDVIEHPEKYGKA